MALWELEELQGPQFLGFIRSVPVPEDFLGFDILPTKTVNQLEYEYVLGAGGKRAIMANVMGWDSEAPIHGRRAPVPANFVRGELPPIKRKARLSEKELIKFNQPRAGSSDVQDVIDYVYDLTTELVDAVQARIEWLKMQSISEDVVTLDSEGVVVSTDFGIPVDQQYNVNTDAGLSTWWEDTSNSNPVSDLDYVCNQFEAVHGFRPGILVCDGTTKNVLLNNVNLRDLIRGSGAPALRLTQEELDALFQLYDLPRLVSYNVAFLEENHDGTTTLVRPFNRRKAVLLPDPGTAAIGNFLLGPTAEANQIPGIAYSPFAPGIVGRVYGKDEPPGEWVKVAATGFPTLPGAQYIVQMLVRNDL